MSSTHLILSLIGAIAGFFRGVVEYHQYVILQKRHTTPHTRLFGFYIFSIILFLMHVVAWVFIGALLGPVFWSVWQRTQFVFIFSIMMLISTSIWGWFKGYFDYNKDWLVHDSTFKLTLSPYLYLKSVRRLIWFVSKFARSLYIISSIAIWSLVGQAVFVSFISYIWRIFWVGGEDSIPLFIIISSIVLGLWGAVTGAVFHASTWPTYQIVFDELSSQYRFLKRPLKFISVVSRPFYIITGLLIGLSAPFSFFDGRFYGW